MSIVTDSYKKAYALKNKALRTTLTAKNAALNSEKKQVRKTAEEDMRSAYSSFVRATARKGQQDRAEGRFGGAAQNAAEGLEDTHRAAQDTRLSQMQYDITEIEDQKAKNTADTEKKIADNEAALEQKVAAEVAKEQKQAASSKNTGKSKVMSMIKMGIYDSSFAGILGVSDSEVRAAVASYKRK